MTARKNRRRRTPNRQREFRAHGCWDHIIVAPLWVEYQVTSQPTMVFIAADRSTETHSGALGPQGLLERVEALAAS